MGEACFKSCFSAAIAGDWVANRGWEAVRFSSYQFWFDSCTHSAFFELKCDSGSSKSTYQVVVLLQVSTNVANQIPHPFEREGAIAWDSQKMLG